MGRFRLAANVSSGFLYIETNVISSLALDHAVSLYAIIIILCRTWFEDTS